MTTDGGELLSYVKRIAEAAERLADHLTRQAIKPVASTSEKPKRHYNEPALEQSHAEGQGIRRPRQASRS